MISLQTLRKKKWITQEVIADLIGTTRQTYSRIEKWEIDLNIWQAVKIAEYFSISVNELLPTDTVATPQDSQFNWDRYVQIIKNFIKYWSDSDGKITKTKLAKLCYLLDFARYYNNLQSVTWLSYRRLDQWPVADAYFAALESLENEKSISIEYKKKAHLISNSKDPKDNLLSEDEKDFLKKIAKKRKKSDTKEIVEFTHKQMPWMMCEDKETIPYSFITQEDPEHVY
jgi:DNA-binding XRE family transcriptional regulator/uncharacterized phage-associated protein